MSIIEKDLEEQLKDLSSYCLEVKGKIDSLEDSRKENILMVKDKIESLDEENKPEMSALLSVIEEELNGANTEFQVNKEMKLADMLDSIRSKKSAYKYYYNPYDYSTKLDKLGITDIKGLLRDEVNDLIDKVIMKSLVLESSIELVKDLDNQIFSTFNRDLGKDNFDKSEFSEENLDKIKKTITQEIRWNCNGKANSIVVFGVPVNSLLPLIKPFDIGRVSKLVTAINQGAEIDLVEFSCSGPLMDLTKWSVGDGQHRILSAILSGAETVPVRLTSCSFSKDSQEQIQFGFDLKLKNNI